MSLRKLFIMSAIVFPFLSNAQEFEKDVVKTKDGHDLTITFIKHGSLMFECLGKVVYVDPISEYADYSKMPKADFIFITHDHYDHYDTNAIKLLTQYNKQEPTKIFYPESMMDKVGMPKYNCDECRFAFGDFVLGIETVPAYNTTPERVQFHPKGRDCGYVLTFNGLKIYVAGDTEDIEEMDRLRHLIDIAFLPVNLPYTMTPDQANNAARMIMPRILYPYHYGETPIEQLKDMLSDTQIDVRIRQMQ